MTMSYCSLVVVLALVVSPALAADDTGQEGNPWYWYNKAVDLANEGKFSEALAANERALSMNESMPVAWANQAGILVQLHRYDDAITAADKVLAFNSTELPNTYAAAYYSKGDALRALGKTDEARGLYEKAYALDNTLVPPDLSRDTPVPETSFAVTLQSTAIPSSSGTPAFPVTTPRSPLSPAAGIAALCALILIVCSKKGSR